MHQRPRVSGAVPSRMGMIRHLGSLPKLLTPCTRPRPPPPAAVRARQAYIPRACCLAGTWQPGSACLPPSHPHAAPPAAAHLASPGLLPGVCCHALASWCLPAGVVLLLARCAGPPHALQPAGGICGVYHVNEPDDKRTETKVFYNRCEVGPCAYSSFAPVGAGAASSSLHERAWKTLPPKCAASAAHPWRSTPATTCMRARPRWSGTSPTGST